MPRFPGSEQGKLGYLTGVVERADAAPAESELADFSELDNQLEAKLTKWRGVLAQNLPALSESMRKSNAPSVASQGRLDKRRSFQGVFLF
jgi:hypothetical protein